MINIRNLYTQDFYMNLHLILSQKPMLKVFSTIILDSFKNKEFNEECKEFSSGEIHIRPNSKIVNAFHKYLKINHRYKKTIAPHLFPQWCFPIIFDLLKETGLPLHKVMNQGCSFKVFGDIPVNETIISQAKLKDIIEEENKYILVQEVVITDEKRKKLLEAQVQAVVMKPNPVKNKSSKRKIEEMSYPVLIPLKFTKKDASQYAQISGDFNPIHISPLMAKLMGFKKSLMHGFGIASHIYENLLNNEYHVNSITYKFIRPLYLDNYVNLHVSMPLTEEKNHFKFKLTSIDDQITHCIGEFTTKL